MPVDYRPEGHVLKESMPKKRQEEGPIQQAAVAISESSGSFRNRLIATRKHGTVTSCCSRNSSATGRTSGISFRDLLRASSSASVRYRATRFSDFSRVSSERRFSGDPSLARCWATAEASSCTGKFRVIRDRADPERIHLSLSMFRGSGK
jgi:hypothetical protein